MLKKIIISFIPGGKEVMAFGQFRNLVVKGTVNSLTKEIWTVNNNSEDFFSKIADKAESKIANLPFVTEMSKGEAIQWTRINWDFIIRKAKTKGYSYVSQIPGVSDIKNISSGNWQAELRKLDPGFTDVANLGKKVLKTKDKFFMQFQEKDILEEDDDFEEDKDPKNIEYTSFLEKSSVAIGARYNRKNMSMTLWIVPIDLRGLGVPVIREIIDGFPVSDWEYIKNNDTFVPYDGVVTWLWKNGYMYYRSHRSVKDIQIQNEKPNTITTIQIKSDRQLKKETKVNLPEKTKIEHKQYATTNKVIKRKPKKPTSMKNTRKRKI